MLEVMHPGAARVALPREDFLAGEPLPGKTANLLSLVALAVLVGKVCCRHRSILEADLNCVSNISHLLSLGCKAKVVWFISFIIVNPIDG